MLPIMLAVGLSSAVYAQSTMKADPNYGVRYVAERVVQLPQDESKTYLTVFGSPRDAEYKQLKSWFSSNPDLSAFRDQTRYNEIETTSALYQGRYKNHVPSGTLVRFQDSEGNVIVDLGDHADTKLPMSAEALAKALNGRAPQSAGCIFKHRKEETKADPVSQPLNDGPPVSTEPTGVFVIFGFVCFLVVICCFFLGIKKEHRSRRHHK